MPALTIAAACRYALTGVGAAMAPGSQKWKGKIADLLSAPTRISTRAASTIGPVGAAARISEMLEVPASTTISTTPISITSPPSVVTRSACRAARRLAARRL